MTTKNNIQKLPVPLLFFHLRALVLALGETVSPPWWKTKFMNETGLRYLERLYPRTLFLAAIHAAEQAACDAHDRAVGRLGVYHLFRLPESLEVEIHRLFPDPADEFFPALRKSLGQPEELMRLLSSMGEDGTMELAAGAKRIGTEKDLVTRRGIAKIAAVYHAAFAGQAPCFPYFSADVDRGAK